MALVDALDFWRFAFRLFRLGSIDIGAGHAGPRFSLCKIRAGLYPQVTEFVSRASLAGSLVCRLTMKFGLLLFNVGQRLQGHAIRLLLQLFIEAVCL